MRLLPPRPSRDGIYRLAAALLNCAAAIIQWITRRGDADWWPW